MSRKAALASLVLGILTLLSVASPAEAAWNLVAQHSGKCAHIWERSTADNAQARQWDCVNERHVKWLVEDLLNNEVYLINVHSGKCLQVSYNDIPKQGALVTQHTCTKSGNSRWKKEPGKGGYFRLRNVASGQCLHVLGESKANGAQLAQWTCGAAPHFYWLFDPAQLVP